MLSSASRPRQHHRSHTTSPLPSPKMMAVQNPTPAYFAYSHHSHGHASSSSPSPFYSQPSSPAYATPTASSSSTPKLQHSSSTSMKSRPKLPHKKPSCSTRDKRADVQLNLEMKVEKAKGFHAFFVPLGKSLPPAPPSSPVLGSTHPPRQAADGSGRKDYFEDWVEDVGRKVGGQGSAMDLD